MLSPICAFGFPKPEAKANKSPMFCLAHFDQPDMRFRCFYTNNRALKLAKDLMKTLCVIAVKKHPQAVSGHASDPNSSFVRITKRDPVAVRKKFLLEPLTSI